MLLGSCKIFEGDEGEYSPNLRILKPHHLINTLKEITKVLYITVGEYFLLERLSWVVDGINCNISKKKYIKVLCWLFSSNGDC